MLTASTPDRDPSAPHHRKNDENAPETEIVSLFGPEIASLPEDPTRLAAEICRTYNLTPEDLFYKWEAFSLQNSHDEDQKPTRQPRAGGGKGRDERDRRLPTRANLEALRSVIVKDVGKTGRSAVNATPGSGSGAARVKHQLMPDFYDKDSLEGLLQGIGVPVTPRVKPSHANLISPSPYRRFQTPPQKERIARDFSTGKTVRQSPAHHHDPFYSASSPVVGRPSDFSSPTRPSPHSVKFAERANKNKKEDVFNSHLPAIATDDETIVRRRKKCQITLAPRQQTRPYRYMFEKISDKSETLDDALDAAAEIIQKHHDIANLDHPAYPSQNLIKTVGRICCDSEARLNSQSVVLEGSRSLGGGCRVKLDLNGLKSFSVFPGQIIGLEGMNSTGDCLAPTRLLPVPLLPMPTSTPESLLDNYHDQSTNTPSEDIADTGAARSENGSPVLVAVVSGPYTFDDNLLFEPLKDLLGQLKLTKPDVIIMSGPFLSSEHPLIRSGDIDLAPCALFRETVSASLRDYCAHVPTSTVVLIPSPQDILHEWCTLPQPPIDQLAPEKVAALALPKEVVCLPNPVQFFVNEMLFAVTSTDVVFHLGAEEAVRAPTPPDRLGRLARHILEQRSFYPLYPPAQGQGGVDSAHLEQIELQATPDVMILTSQLKYFAKNVENVLAINPGHLTKKQSAGTYALLTVHAPHADDLRAALSSGPDAHDDGDGDVSMGDATTVDEDAPKKENREAVFIHHEVLGRSRVDIVRI